MSSRWSCLFNLVNRFLVPMLLTEESSLPLSWQEGKAWAYKRSEDDPMDGSSTGTSSASSNTGAGKPHVCHLGFKLTSVFSQRLRCEEYFHIMKRHSCDSCKLWDACDSWQTSCISCSSFWLFAKTSQSSITMAVSKAGRFTSEVPEEDYTSLTFFLFVTWPLNMKDIRAGHERRHLALSSTIKIHQNAWDSEALFDWSLSWEAMILLLPVAFAAWLGRRIKEKACFSWITNQYWQQKSSSIKIQTFISWYLEHGYWWYYKSIVFFFF